VEKNDQILKEQIVLRLGDLTESIIRRVPPGNEIPVQPEACPAFFKFIKYSSDLEPFFRERILEARIARARFHYNARFPEYQIDNKPFGPIRK
jgi:hypothetical protein